MHPDRIGNYMVTSTGRKFWPLDPRPHEVEIEVIAHHLAARNRWNGATLWPYSVAQHSLYVSRLVPIEDALEGLLHDAAEGYSPFGDVTRPFKDHFTVVREVEEPIEIAIAVAFGLRWPWPASVHAADNAVGAAEALQIIKHDGEWDGVRYEADAADIRIERLAPEVVERAFLGRFRFLMRMRERSAAGVQIHRQHRRRSGARRLLRNEPSANLGVGDRLGGGT